MIDSGHPSAIPAAEDFIGTARSRDRRILIGSLLLSLISGLSYIAFGLDSPILPFVLLIAIAGALLLWHYAPISLYVTFAAVCLFEMAQVPYSDSLTERVPFFWNINTILQTYAHVNFKAVPLNLLEVILVVAGVASFIRAVGMNRVSFRLGPLFIPIFIYLCFVTFGWINGMATGGDFKLSLQEVRAQFYLMIAYLMAVNIIKTPQQAVRLMGAMVICIGLKGCLYTFRRYVTLAGLPLPDQGVGSHEEAFFFNCFVVLLVTLAVCGEQARLRRWMWFLLPLVITGNLATNRRAATAAMIVVLPILLLTAFCTLPQRRKMAVTIGSLLGVGFLLYYPLFKNSTSMIGQPARAIRSQFQPDARDASSNIYRDAENQNLMATIRLSPIQGYGYGKRMLHAVPIADISRQYEWWDLLPHNQILWVWMRTGTLGFIAFWMMVSSIILFLCRTLRSPDTSNLAKAVGIFTLLTLSMLMIFGLLDLQISNFRDMLFTGFWIGIAAGLPGWKKTEETEEAVPPSGNSQNRRNPQVKTPRVVGEVGSDRHQGSGW
jgi:O-antigen ligase